MQFDKMEARLSYQTQTELVVVQNDKGGEISYSAIL